MADIVIRGMEIPKDHPVLVFIWPDGRVFPHGLYKSNEWDGVKAVPLPEGHGRLGDLDTAEAILHNKAFDLATTSGEHDGVMWAFRQIKALPSILEAEGNEDG